MGLRRYELSDFEWAIIQSLLPNKPRGGRTPRQSRLGTTLEPSAWGARAVV